jgi:hypothetical protein
VQKDEAPVRRLLAPALLLVAACSEGPASVRPPGGATLEAAIALFNDAKFDEAEQASRRLTVSSPGDPVAFRLLGRILALRNRTKEAAAAYAQAVNLSLDPRRGYTDGASVEELAWVCYRMDEYAQAANWFGVLKDSILEKKYRDMAQGRSPYTCRWTDGEITAPLTMRDGLPTVRWRVNGVDGVFGVDTGGGEFALDGAFARKSTTQVIGSRQDMKGTSVEHAIVNTIDAGRGLSIVNVPAQLASLRRKTGPELDGLIGVGLLSHFAVTINFAKGSLTLRPAGRAPAGHGTQSPLLIAGDRYLLMEGTVELLRDGKTTTQKVLLQLNTGRPKAGFVPAESFLRGITGATLKRVVVAGIEEVPTRLDSALFPQGLDFAFGFPIAGLVGPEFFRGKSVTLDFEGMTVRVE